MVKAEQNLVPGIKPEDVERKVVHAGDLRTGTFNSLARAGWAYHPTPDSELVISAGALAEAEDGDLLRVRNFGEKSLEAIKEVIKELAEKK